jgi:hypothetical protein
MLVDIDHEKKKHWLFIARSTTEKGMMCRSEDGADQAAWQSCALCPRMRQSRYVSGLAVAPGRACH